MAGVDKGRSDSDTDSNGEDSPSNYFSVEIVSRKNEGAGRCRYGSDDGGESKVRVKVSSQRDKPGDVAVTARRNVAGRESDSVRPPVVGRAAPRLEPAPAAPRTASSDSEPDDEPRRALAVKVSYPDCPQDEYDREPVPSTPENDGPSSACSVASSRPLEWDSGADVGYNVPDDRRLSTVEKLALAQGSAMIFKRCDPEGTTSNNKPAAQSTPKPDAAKEIRLEASKTEKNAYPLFPEVSVKTLGAVSDGSASPDLPQRETDVEVDTKRPSSSSDETGRRNRGDDPIRRSHSQNNVHDNAAKQPLPRVDSAKSRSSSSLSTVVNKKSSERSLVYRGNKYVGGACGRESDGDDRAKRGLDEAESGGRTTPPENGRFDTLDSLDPLTAEARVNSFEYLPGHVYENSVNVKADGDSSDGLLQPEVERAARMLARLIQCDAGDCGVSRERLVRRVVERLVLSDSQEVLPESRGQISGESSTEKSDVRPSPPHPSTADKCVGTGISTSLSGYTESSVWNSAAESSRKSSECLLNNYAGRCRGKVDKKTQVGSDATTSHPSIARKDSSKYKGDKVRKDDDGEVILYLEREKKNQLHWIKSEIDHLSNLKKLLEKQEVLKKNLDHLKRKGERLENPLKCYSERVQARKSKMKKNWRNGISAPGYSRGDAKQYSDDSGSSQHKDCGWTSHHYETSDETRPDRKENTQPKFFVPRSKTRQSDSKLSTVPTATSYTITFPNKKSGANGSCRQDDDILLSVGELKSAIDQIVERHRVPPPPPSDHRPLSLKEILKCERPDYIQNAEARRQILSEIVELRQRRQNNKQVVIAAAQADLPGPTPPLATRRVFSQQCLRKQTEKKYKQLSEVRHRRAELKRKEEYRTNRLMAQVFNRKLQKRTLQGQVNLSNSICVVDPTK